MKCPRCQRENYPGAKFCIGCGARLEGDDQNPARQTPDQTPAQPYPVYAAPPVQPAAQPSKAGTFFRALLHGLLYFILFFGIQSVVMFVYEFIVTLKLAGGMIPAITNGEFESVFETLLDQVMANLTENIHLLMILSAVLTVLVYCLSFRLRHKNPMEEMNIRPVSFIRLPAALALGLAAQTVVSVLLTFLPLPEAWYESLAETNEMFFGGPAVIEFIDIALLTPIIEELTFRGLVYSRLRRGMSAVWALILSAVIFGIAHGHILSFLYASLLGLLLAGLMTRSGNSVLVPICCHIGFNLGSYLLAFVPDNVPVLISLFALCLAVSVALSYLLLRRAPAAVTGADDDDDDDDDDDGNP